MLLRISTKAVLVAALLFSSLAWSQDKSLKTLQGAFLNNRDNIYSTLEKIKATTDDETLKKLNDKLEYLFTESNKDITAIYDLQGVKYEIKEHTFDNIGKTEYIKILPTGEHYLNRFAKFLNRFDVNMAVCPKVIFLRDINAEFTHDKIFLVSYRAGSLTEKEVDTSIHEMLHSFFQAMWGAGYDSDFLGYALSTKGSINSTSGKVYDDYVSMEELATYAENSSFDARKLYRDLVTFYGNRSPTLDKIADILVTKFKDKQLYDVVIDKQYDDIWNILLTFMVSPKYSKGRDEKLLSKATTYFGDDVESNKKFAEAVAALYNKEDLLSETPQVDLSTSTKEQADKTREFLKPVIDQIAGLYADDLVTEVGVASKLEYVLKNIIYDMLNATYHDDTPSKDYDGAYKFTSNLIIQYRAEKNVKYYVVSFFRDDIEYTTLINKENIKTSDEDAIINAAYAKVTKQLNMVKTFKAKNEEIKKDVEKSALLPVMDDTEDKEKVAVAIEDHANKIDINSLNIKDMLDDITSYKEKTEKVRELYRDNIAVGVDNWGDVIKKFPVKTTDNTVTKTTMTTDEIQQANKLLTQLTNIKKTVKGKQEDIDLLIKYLKWADENGKTLVASTIRTSLSSDYYKSCLSLEQLALVNNSQKVSYVGSGTDNVFSEEAFRDMLIGLTKMKKSKLVDISTDQLAALCIKDIVETINKRWSKGNTTIAELLLDKEVKILAGKDGLIDFIRNKIDLLPSGSAARRAYVYSLDTFMDLVSATSPTRVVTMAPDFNTDERKLEVKKLVEKEKTNDFLYDEEYGDQKSSNEKFMMMDNSLKEMK